MIVSKNFIERAGFFSCTPNAGPTWWPVPPLPFHLFGRAQQAMADIAAEDVGGRVCNVASVLHCNLNNAHFHPSTQAYYFSFLPTEIAEKILFFVPPRAELPLALVCGKWYDILERRRALRRAAQWVTSKKIALGSRSLLRWAKGMGCGMVLVRTLGKKGRGPGDLESPRGIALDNIKLWLADLFNGRIQALDSITGESVATMRGSRKEEIMNFPFGIVIAPTSGLVCYESRLEKSAKPLVGSLAFPVMSTTPISCM